MVAKCSPWMSRRIALAVSAGIAAASSFSTPANAIPVLNTTLTTPAVTPSCNLHAGSGDEKENGMGMPCRSTAYTPALADWASKFIVGKFDIKPPTNETFQTAFTNWNVAQGANFGGMWAIKNGGNLDLTFKVVDTAAANANLGGINPFTIDITKNAGYAGPAIGQLVWSQAVYSSYEFKPPFKTDLNPPNVTLDTWSLSKGNPNSPGFTNPCTAIPGQTPGANNTTPATIGPSPTSPTRAYCDPIYPFQLANARFFDAPRAFWPDESFRGIALLSTVTFLTDAAGKITERDLTVYNGVSWGFDLSVPEPTSLLLLLPSSMFVFCLRRRRPGQDWFGLLPQTNPAR